MYDEAGVAVDMLDFVQVSSAAGTAPAQQPPEPGRVCQALLAAHPELASKDFYVTGESCARKLQACTAPAAGCA